MVSQLHLAQFSHLTFEECHSKLCGVFGIPRNGIFFHLISASDTSTKREAAILKICPPAIITSPEVIIEEYDAILGQWEREDFYNHLSNYTKWE